MPIEFKDYYKVLGVGPSASDAEIKNAFRALARKHHPDVAKDKTGAESRFSDFFEQFFARRGRPPGGFGPAWQTGPRGEARAQRGRDIEGDILVTLDEVLRGSVRTITRQRTDSRTGQAAVETLRVTIPPGVRETQMIRLRGKGQEGLDGGESGNLYLRVTFAKHPDFRVRGIHLYHALALSPWEAVLGARVPVPTLDGTAFLRIPPGTAAEQEFRLRGLGLPAGNGTRGDLHAIVSIQVPSHPTPEQKALWAQLATASAFNPRNNA